MSIDYIYPKKIRLFEKELIDFIVESGKNKRSSDIESHILAYFFFHQNLTQKQIQELSSIFRNKKISKGSISQFLNQYEKYGVLERKKLLDKKNSFNYSLINRNVRNLISSGSEIGLSEVQKWIKFLEIRIKILPQIRPNPNQVELHKKLMERVKELRDFLIFHNDLLMGFLEVQLNQKKNPKTRISSEIINDMKRKDITEIEKEIINFIQNNPLFMIDEIKYLPILSYLITRKKLTQNTLQKLTGLSSGLISEGLNYLLNKKFIILEKIRGIRKRYYALPSIGYTNYLKQYKRFRYIYSFRAKFETIYKEMTDKHADLHKLNGYKIIREWVEQALKSFEMVKSMITLFENAINYFESKLNLYDYSPSKT